MIPCPGRSYQNPIGSVYHEPGGEEGGWAWAAPPPEEEGGGGGPWTRAEEEGGGPWTRAEEDRAWAGRNLLPYETLSGFCAFLSFFFSFFRVADPDPDPR